MQKVLVHIGGNYVLYFWDVIAFSARKQGEEIKFMFSKKATKIDEIFTVDLTVTTYCQIDDEDFVKFCGLLRKREL